MFAYGWILDAVSHEVVWALTPRTGHVERNNYVFDGDVHLQPGTYIAYYAAYGSWRGTQKILRIMGKNLGRIEIGKGHRRRSPARDSSRWGLRIETRSSDDMRQVETLQKRHPDDARIFLQLVGMSDNDYEQKGFSLPQKMPVTVYCLGEYDESNDSMADNGWILNADTRERVWELGRDNFKFAGGAPKNKFARETITLPAGNYMVCYSCDFAHSTDAWNEPPPYDPDSWGITLWAATETEARRVKPYQDEESARSILSLTRQGDEAYVSQGFSLAHPSKVRVYALGEYSFSSEEFADYGWIEAWGSHRRVWEMTRDNCKPAGGAQKNRAADETVDLPAGDYVAYYMTDDSHSYGNWNSTPPHDPTHWGITVSGVGPSFDRSTVKLFDAETRGDKDQKYLVRLIRVGSDQHVRQRFHLDRPTRVRILCVGEGVDQEMFDYGWIEDTKGDTAVWEMTGRNSRHAGGARKNRIFDGNVLLDRGDYEANYVTDSSHAWGDWNDTRPPDPHLWGLTVSVAPDEKNP
jgi:hypothetical protein